MLKDRAQKASALKLCVSKRWLPQLEVEVEPTARVVKEKYLLTDLDVLAIKAEEIGQHSKIVFDCKSGAKESGIARAFWLSGVMSKVNAKHGFVILNSRVNLSCDHRVSASDLNVSLLQERELEGLASGLGGSINIPTEYSEASNIDTWEAFFEINKKFPNLSEYLIFSRSSYWAISNPGEQCRKTVAKLRSIKFELDPSKPEHMAVFGDAICLFLVAVSNLATKLLLILMQPTSREEFSSLLLAFLYGGYENLQAALKIRKFTSGAASDDFVSIFPDTDRFEHLVREVVQHPQQALSASLLAREQSLCALTGVVGTSLQYDISLESRYSTKYVLLAAEYLQKSLSLPPEFSQYYSDSVLSLLNSK